MVYRGSDVEPKWLLVGVFFVSGVFFGGLYMYLSNNSQDLKQVKIHPNTGHFQYTNPTLVTEPIVDYNTFSTVSKDLELHMNAVVADAKKTGSVSDVGIYFRDLEAGKWLAIDANMQFSPGILLKLPIVIAYYKLAERDPLILDETIHYDRSFTIHHEDLFTKETPLIPGHDYSARYLLQKMIDDSDETIAGLLFDHIDKNALNEVFSDLGIDFTEDKTTRDFISIKRYSFFFRMLYNATYLSTESSNTVLSLFTHTNNTSLLQTHLPHSVSFINRTSGRVFTAANKPTVEVYECGIVYYPSHPYLLCAAARGPARAGINTLFDAIGSTIYSDVSYQYRS